MLTPVLVVMDVLAFLLLLLGGRGPPIVRL